MSCRRRKLKGVQSTKTGQRHNMDHSKNSGPNDVFDSNILNTDAEGDKDVVEWWRSHQRENGTNDFAWEREQLNLAPKTNMHQDVLYDESIHRNYMHSTTTSPFTDTWEHNEFKSRMQERPYNNSHKDVLANPRNGMVLDPRLFPLDDEKEKFANVNPSLGVFQTKGRSDSDNGADRIEFFQPEIVQTLRAKQQNWKLQSQNLNLSVPSQIKDTPATTFINTTEEGEEVSVNSFVAKTKESSDQLRRKAKVSKKLSLSQFMVRKSKATSVTARRANATELSDHLSDVPSDIDSITRERYLLACQMLKMTIIRKESALIPIEKEYILSLLDDFETHSVHDSELSVDHINNIELAVLRLEKDSLSTFPQDGANVFLPSPVSAARVQKSKKAGGVVQAMDSLPPGSDKNPHTATRKSNKFLDQINACNPRRAPKLLGGEIDQHDEADFFLDDDVVPKNKGSASHNDTGGLVRFDGWSFQNLLEYPFSIIDTYGYDTNPRVFTPGVMEALRGFMPMKAMDHNFWLRFSLARDGTSFTRLLASIRASAYTMIGIETDRGEVFGSFTGRPWRIGSKWYGSSESFLWRLKQTRYTSARNSTNPHFEREIEVYPCTEDDDLIQYCTPKTIAVGGGEWQYHTCPYRDSGQGIGLVIDGDLAGGETNSCATFANPKLARYASSSNEFVISNLEVWSMTPCNTVEDATKLEMREFFVPGYDL